jgi:hypothetical protein
MPKVYLVTSWYGVGNVAMTVAAATTGNAERVQFSTRSEVSVSFTLSERRRQSVLVPLDAACKGTINVRSINPGCIGQETVRFAWDGKSDVIDERGRCLSSKMDKMVYNMDRGTVLRALAKRLEPFAVPRTSSDDPHLLVLMRGRWIVCTLGAENTRSFKTFTPDDLAAVWQVERTFGKLLVKQSETISERLWRPGGAMCERNFLAIDALLH